MAKNDVCTQLIQFMFSANSHGNPMFAVTLNLKTYSKSPNLFKSFTYICTHKQTFNKFRSLLFVGRKCFSRLYKSTFKNLFSNMSKKISTKLLVFYVILTVVIAYFAFYFSPKTSIHNWWRFHLLDNSTTSWWFNPSCCVIIPQSIISSLSS